MYGRVENVDVMEQCGIMWRDVDLRGTTWGDVEKYMGGCESMWTCVQHCEVNCGETWIDEGKIIVIRCDVVTQTIKM